MLYSNLPWHIERMKKFQLSATIEKLWLIFRFSLVFALTGCGLPTVLVTHNLPDGTLMTKIVLATYASPGKSAAIFVRLKLREKFPEGMTRLQAESTGLKCDEGIPIKCRFAGIIVQEMVGSGRMSFKDGSKKREVAIEIELPDASNIESLNYSSTTKVIEQER